MSTNVLRIDVDGMTVTEHTVEGDTLHGLQALVGGWLEGFGVGDAVEGLGLWAYCNEEGRLEGLPHNPIASLVCGHPVTSLVGPIIFTRPDEYDEDGNATSNPPLTQEQIDGLRNLALDAYLAL